MPQEEIVKEIFLDTISEISMDDRTGGIQSPFFE